MPLKDIFECETSIVIYWRPMYLFWAFLDINYIFVNKGFINNDYIYIDQLVSGAYILQLTGEHNQVSTKFIKL